MDTSKEYIKMCDCPEIQGQWKIEIGDNYWDDEVHQIVWYEGMESKEQIKGRIEAYKTDLQPKWLPRQDQIQGMLREHYARKIKSKRPHDKWFPEGAVGLSYVLRGFCTHIKKNQLLLEKYKSFEQLWLAFYMWEIDESVWIKDKWII